MDMTFNKILAEAQANFPTGYLTTAQFAAAAGKKCDTVRRNFHRSSKSYPQPIWDERAEEYRVSVKEFARWKHEDSKKPPALPVSRPTSPHGRSK